MVKTAIDLGPYKAQMITWFMDENKTVKEIAELLYSLYNVVVVSRTIERRFKDWNITKRIRAENTAALRARIAYMFCILGFTDNERRPRSKVSGLQGVKTLSSPVKYAMAHAYPINTL